MSETKGAATDGPSDDAAAREDSSAKPDAMIETFSESWPARARLPWPVRAILGVVLFVASCAAALWFYEPTLRTFFVNDDWVIMHYYREVTPATWWQYFTTETLWFWRPLQSLQFGLLYNWYGFDERAHAIPNLVMHVGVVWLVGVLAFQMTRQRMVAAMTVVLFLTTWIYYDIVIWKANANTLQYALLVMAASACMARHVWTGGRGALWSSWALTALTVLTKEQAVNVPQLLAAVWYLAPRRDGSDVVKSVGSAFGPGGAMAINARNFWEALRALFVPGIIIVVYVAFHRTMIRSGEKFYQVYYEWSSPLEGLLNHARAMQHVLTGWPARDIFPATLGGALGSEYVQFVVGLAVMSMFLLVAAVGRSRVTLFGFAWMMVALQPVIWLTIYHNGRYYYVPTFAGALMWAQLVCTLGGAAAARWSRRDGEGAAWGVEAMRGAARWREWLMVRPEARAMVRGGLALKVAAM